ncbi:MAG: endolytic peptidoglycan transglycosylase RlpA [Enterobacteriaceae bacterium]|jgi:rare lipoprotein A|nr:endolytic peptidoglycan transglycosylase RlpA [Enterobacteriaceae bacterium]
MRQQWLILGIMAVLISGCTTDDNEKSPSPVLSAPAKDILGAEPVYEPYHPSANQDYSRDGESYHIVQNLAQFTQTGYASQSGEGMTGRLTAIGERANPYALTASHPTLPIPSYVRVTNLSNGRMMVVRVNDRGPYKPGKIVELSRSVAERLNLMPQSRVKLDGIQVAPDGSLSGLGTEGSTIVKQSYALPDRPTLNTSAGASTNMTPPVSEQKPLERDPLDSKPLEQDHAEQGLLKHPESQVATQPENIPAVTEQPAAIQKPRQQAIETASTTIAGYMVQVGAVSSEQRAKEWQQSLSQRFNTRGRVMQFGHVYRVQLGPFSDRQQVAELQNKLMGQMNQSSFIVAP